MSDAKLSKVSETHEICRIPIIVLSGTHLGYDQWIFQPVKVM